MDKKRELLWKDEAYHDFITDMSSFVGGMFSGNVYFKQYCLLDKRIVFGGDSYELHEATGDTSETSEFFRCPNCGHTIFRTLEGELNDKPTVGLGCEACKTYGVFFFDGA